MKFLLLYLMLNVFSISSNIQPPILFTPESKPNNEISIKDYDIKDDKKANKSFFIRWGAKSLNWSKKTDINNKIIFELNFGWIKHQKNLLNANKIEIIGKNIDKAILRGNIKIQDKQNQILLRAGFGIYNKKKEKIEIKNEPRFYSLNNNNFFSVTSEKIVRDFEKKQTYFEKSINFTGRDFTIICEKATLDENESKLVTDNFPYFFLQNSFLTGEIFEYWNKEKKAILEKKVTGFFFII